MSQVLEPTGLYTVSPEAFSSNSHLIFTDVPVISSALGLLITGGIVSFGVVVVVAGGVVGTGVLVGSVVVGVGAELEHACVAAPPVVTVQI